MQWQGKWRGGSHLRMCLCSCCAINRLILIFYIYQKRCATRSVKNWVAPKNENENIHHYYLSSKVVGIGPVRQPEEGGYPSGKQGQAGKGVGRQKQEGISRGWRQEAGARRASTVVRQGWPRRKEDQLAAGGSVRPHVGPRACVVLPGASVDQAQQHGLNHGRGLVGHVQLLDGVLDVEVHRVLRQREDVRNVLGGLAVSRPLQHLDLAAGEMAHAGGILAADDPRQQRVRHLRQPLHAVVLLVQLVGRQGGEGA